MSESTLLEAFAPMAWDLLATYSITSEHFPHWIPCDSASCDLWFFAPKKDWYKYSFRSQNMIWQCNLIVKLSLHQACYTYTDTGVEKRSYWQVSVCDREMRLPKGYTWSGEIAADKFSAKELETCLWRQLPKIPRGKLDSWDTRPFPPTRFFPTCGSDFWRKVGRKCFSPYIQPFRSAEDIFCMEQLCPICDKSHAPATLDLMTGRGAHFHPDIPSCSVCGQYHYPHKLIVDEFCHIALKTPENGSVPYHS